MRPKYLLLYAVAVLCWAYTQPCMAMLVAPTDSRGSLRPDRSGHLQAQIVRYEHAECH